MIQQLRSIQSASLQDSSTNSETNRDLDRLNSQIIAANKDLVAEISGVKRTPGAAKSTNARQVKLLDEKITRAFQNYQTSEMDYRRKFQAQLVRQYRIINPNATEEDARRAADDPQQGGMFAQALMNSDRRGQAQSTLRAVQDRHEAIQQIEQQMMQLADLFQQMNELVLQQEPVVQQIEQQATNVQTDVTNANVQLDGAIEKARSRNKKKWWCLGLSILILIIIAVIVVVVLKPWQK